jgi:cell wall-associated NlpC family hydrolase
MLRRGALIAASVMVVAMPGVGSVATAAMPSATAAATTAPATTTPTPPTPPTPAATSPLAPGLPPIPVVTPAITNGQDPKVLLSRALTLLDAANRTTPIQPLLASLSRTLTADLTNAQRAQAAAAAADARAVAAARVANADRTEAAALLVTLRRATLSLYMNGSPTPLVHLAPVHADDLAAAVVGVQVALSPTGILAAHQHAAADADAATKEAQSAQQAAHAAADQAELAYTAATAQSQALQNQAATLATSDAAALAAEQALLSNQASQADQARQADQAGQAVPAPSPPRPLQFTPTTPMPAPANTAAVALSWAFSELGKPYVPGAAGPGNFDCGGLPQYAWAKAGITTPRLVTDQYSWSVPVPLSDLLPGDLVFFGTSDIHDEGVYIGDGLMINAAHTGAVVRISPVFYPELAGFGRVHGPGIVVASPPATAAPPPPTCDTAPSGVALPLPARYLHGGSVDEGVDYDAPGGTPEFAMGTGTIIDEGISGFGPNCPVLQITSGPLTGKTVYYGHAGPDLVPVGAQVMAGQQITEVGNGIVGISSGPHLEIGFYPPTPNAGGAMLDLLNQVTASNTGG